MESVLLNHIDSPPERIFKIGYQPSGKERRRVRTSFNQQVQVTVRPRLAAYKRTEYFHACYAVAMRNRQDPIPFSHSQLFQSHRKYL
jgi:hypothetical protein